MPEDVSRRTFAKSRPWLERQGDYTSLVPGVRRYYLNVRMFPQTSSTPGQRKHSTVISGATISEVYASVNLDSPQHQQPRTMKSPASLSWRYRAEPHQNAIEVEHTLTVCREVNVAFSWCNRLFYVELPTQLQHHIREEGSQLQTSLPCVVKWSVSCEPTRRSELHRSAILDRRFGHPLPRQHCLSHARRDTSEDAKCVRDESPVLATGLESNLA